MITLDQVNTFNDFKKFARHFISNKIAPENINWGESERLLFDETLTVDDINKNIEFTVSKAYLQLAESLAMLRDKNKWSLLYRILYRLKLENKNLLNIPSDKDIRAAHIAQKSIGRDIHKMHAFVRFKKIENQGEKFVAWHKPEHLILKAAVPFFVDRFGDKSWSILTPDESAHWDGEKVEYTPGVAFEDFKITDDWDEVWKDYYRAIYNPARLNIKMMKQEMSPKYWQSMPEAEIIQELIKDTPNMLKAASKSMWGEAYVDPEISLTDLPYHLSHCTACPLYEKATQAVPGQGPLDAKLMLLGEQPGDKEDLSGLPFVGPAGQLLNNCFNDLEIKRDELYITSAVKHFSFTENIKGERIHRSPTGKQIHACKPWLEAELNQIKPQVILAMGVTAATAVLGKKPIISKDRGQIFSTKYAKKIIVTWHPASILRSVGIARENKLAQLKSDIQLAHYHAQL